MRKTLLVLAASTYQLPAITTAKRLGYAVITVDNLPGNPGHALADASFDIDTTDAAAILALARQQRIGGVIAPGTDVAVVTASVVAEALGLPGPSSRAARILTDKRTFRTFLAEAGFGCPRVFTSASEALASRSVPATGAWLLKPARSSGSKGVFIVRGEDLVRGGADIDSRLAQSRAFSLDGEALLEAFIEGSQHTCEGILRDGRIDRWLLTDRDTVPAPYTATAGHRVPSTLAPDRQAEALRQIAALFSRLSVRDGPFDCDFVASGADAVLIEATPRLGGNSLSKLFQAALGIDLVEYAVRHACGDPCPLPPGRAPMAAAVAILGVDRPGRIRWDRAQLDALRDEAWVGELSLDVAPGDAVQAFVNGRHRLGEALVTGETRADVDARVEALKRRLALEAV